jgi:hypothetical protein
MLHEPMRRLTLFIPLSLHEQIQQQARAEFSRTSEFARRAPLAAVRKQQNRVDACPPSEGNDAAARRTSASPES